LVARAAQISKQLWTSRISSGRPHICEIGFLLPAGVVFRDCTVVASGDVLHAYIYTIIVLLLWRSRNAARIFLKFLTHPGKLLRATSRDALLKCCKRPQECAVTAGAGMEAAGTWSFLSFLVSTRVALSENGQQNAIAACEIPRLHASP
jgi:hypothetical protein